MGTIYNLEYDFNNQNGQSIVFSKKNGTQLTPTDLNAVQLKMIQSNQIPHMLPLSLENIDLKAKLHYDISSKQKLITYFRDNKTMMNDYYQLFLSIIHTIEEAGSYMLDQNQYILSMEFLYIGQHAGDVYLTYLPVNGVEKETSLTDDMKRLLTEVAGEIEGLQGNEFKSILSYIKKSSFSIPGLKQLLLELISLRSNVYQQQAAYQQPNQMQMGSTETNTNQAPNQQQGNQGQAEQIVAGSENQKQKQTKIKKKLPPLSSREKVYMILSVVLVSAFAIKLFDMYPTVLTLIGTPLLILLAIAGAITYWKFWRPGVEAVEVEVEDKKATNKQTPAQPQAPAQQQQVPKMSGNMEGTRPQQAPFEANPAQNIQINPTPYAQPSPAAVQQPQTNFNLNQEQVSMNHQQQAPQQEQSAFQPVFATDAGSSALDTTLLNEDPDDTVLLSAEDELAAGMEATDQVEIAPVIKRMTEDEEPSYIEVNAKNFLVGRNEEAVNYTEIATGVSRMHVEFIHMDGSSYGVKDLGSKNGSKLNGNPMVPYKLYPLNENDEIELGKAHYTFTWGNM